MKQTFQFNNSPQSEPKVYSFAELKNEPGIYVKLEQLTEKETYSALLVTQFNGSRENVVLAVYDGGNSHMQSPVVCIPIGEWEGKFVKYNGKLTLTFEN